MEPLTLTAGAIVSLAFAKLRDKTLEKFSEAAIAKIDELRKKIWDKLRGNPKAKAALEAVEQGSQADLDKVAAHLNLEMLDNPEFAKELHAIAQEINAGKRQDNSSMTQINQDNARGWQTKVEGGTAYIGEIHQHGTSPKPEQT